MKKIFFGITALAVSVTLTSCATHAHKPIVPPPPEQLTNRAQPPVTNPLPTASSQPELPTAAQPPAPSQIEAPAPVPTTGQPLAGGIERTMDNSDKDKMSHALDKKLGKSTKWTNERTNMTYTVVPVKKLVIDGNHFCRQYKVISEHNGAENEFDGTACVSGTDGSWQSVK